MNAGEGPPFEQRMQQVEGLVETIERSPDVPTREAAREMVRTLLELHGAGLAKMLELLPASDGRQELLDAWIGNELVRSILLLHGLHPETLESRVQAALEKVRPYLHSHGGDVRLVDVAGSVVRLAMHGSCQGCPSSSDTLKQTIEKAIHDEAPDVTAIEVAAESAEPSPHGFVQLETPARSPTQLTGD
jgi:Fe-S cluster biogenesis protein NfuA